MTWTPKHFISFIGTICLIQDISYHIQLHLYYTDYWVYVKKKKIHYRLWKKFRISNSDLILLRDFTWMPLKILFFFAFRCCRWDIGIAFQLRRQLLMSNFYDLISLFIIITIFSDLQQIQTKFVKNMYTLSLDKFENHNFDY